MKTSSLSLAAALGAIVALSAAAPQAAPRFVVDPEKPTLERSGWTYIGMADGVLIYMRDAVPGSSGHARRVLTAPHTASACSVCFGDPDSPWAKALGWGILVLLGIVAAVDAFVAEDPAQLEDTVEATDEQTLEVQLQ